MEICECINTEYDIEEYKIRKCKDRGCRMKIGQISSKIIYDIEQYIKDNKRNSNNETINSVDCLILCIYNSEKKAALIELKGKGPHLKCIEEKFENSFDALDDFIKKEKKCEFNIYPILLLKSLSTEEYRKLDGIRIKNKYLIIIGRCNAYLSEIFKNYEK